MRLSGRGVRRLRIGVIRREERRDTSNELLHILCVDTLFRSSYYNN